MRKIRVFITMLIVGTIILTSIGCSEQSEKNNSSSIKNEENQVDKDNKKDEKELVDYKAIYKEEVEQLISKYGKFKDPGNSLTITGVKYGELLDFDNSGIPEMIIVHDRKVLLYTIKDGIATCIYEGEAGSRYGQTDLAYTIGINTSNEKPYLIVYHSTKEWTDENISLITLEKGNIITKELAAKTDGNNDIPNRESLVSFYIDGKSVTDQEYNKVYDSIVKDAKEIDVCWNNNSATDSDLENFLNSLQ